MLSDSTSILHISDPYKSDSLNRDFRRAQQTWLQLATVPFHELTADSSLGMLVTSAQIAQQSPFNTVFLYALAFDGDAVLLLPKRAERPTTSIEVLTVPHQGLTVFPSEELSQTSIRTAVANFLHNELGVLHDPESVFLMKPVLPVSNGPIVAVVVRKDVASSRNLQQNGSETGKWFTRQQLAELKEHDLYPEGMKQLTEEAFAQREFEADVVAL